LTNFASISRTEQIVISLRFKSLLVDKPHPKAKRELVSTVISSSRSPEDYTAVVNEFALLLITGQRVLIWNWLTGKCHARIDTTMPGGITEASFLQRTAFMAFRQVENTPKLEVYSFSAKEPTSEEPPPPILRAIYLLPSLQNGVEMVMQCRCDPPPFQYSHLVQPDMSSFPIDPPCYMRRPFQIQETSRTLVLAINVRTDTGQHQDLVIFAPLQAFISTNLDPEAPKREPQVVPASEWMRDSHVFGNIPLSDQWIYGTRFATVITDSPGQRNFCMFDFNPAIAKYLKHKHGRNRSQNEYPEPEAGVKQSVEDQDIIEWTEGNAVIILGLSGTEFTDEMIFKEPLQGGAPVLISISEEGIDVLPNETLRVLIDDERVLLARVSRSASVLCAVRCALCRVIQSLTSIISSTMRLAQVQ